MLTMSSSSTGAGDGRYFVDESGFRYRFDRQSVSQKDVLFWRCQRHKNGCSARIHTTNGVVVKRLHEHNHELGDAEGFRPATSAVTVAKQDAPPPPPQPHTMVPRQMPPAPPAPPKQTSSAAATMVPRQMPPPPPKQEPATMVVSRPQQQQQQQVQQQQVINKPEPQATMIIRQAQLQQQQQQQQLAKPEPTMVPRQQIQIISIQQQQQQPQFPQISIQQVQQVMRLPSISEQMQLPSISSIAAQPMVTTTNAAGTSDHASNNNQNRPTQRFVNDHGYKFIFDRGSVSNKDLMFWRCQRNKQGCPARIHTLNGTVVKRFHEHNHFADQTDGMSGGGMSRANGGHGEELTPNSRHGYFYDAGHVYVFNRQSVKNESSLFWVCQNSAKGCRARLHTSNGAVMKRINEHNHAPLYHFGNVSMHVPSGHISNGMEHQRQNTNPIVETIVAQLKEAIERPMQRR